eukprot:TRINITY_DN13917_c0_g2_i3.p1 TRINITY_DN13917_c0_g2~~TRINITY_DN13917_c0_g2_i3.p1  ORF type:complete len:404 (-),score=101.30 TRINITY_DN13917_c0_g2_i3:27-1238(-)
MALATSSMFGAGAGSMFPGAAPASPSPFTLAPSTAKPAATQPLATPNPFALPAAPTSSIFPAPTATPSSAFGSYMNSAPATPAAPSASPFAFPSTTAAPSTTSTLSFAPTTANNLFAPPAAAPAANPFAMPMTSPLFPSLPSGYSMAYGQQPQPQQPQLPPAIATLKGIEDAYRPDSDACRFRHMFYNVVSSSDISRYTKPPNVNERLWAAAIAENPDPSRLVPVQGLGAKDLAQRIAAQDQMAEQHQTALATTQKNLQTLQQQHDLVTLLKIDQFRRTHLELARRLLRVLGTLETVRARGTYLSPDEAKWRAKVEALLRELNSPSSLRGRVLEIVAAVGARPDQAGATHATLDDEALSGAYHYLEQRQRGIASVRDVLIKDLKDANLILETLTKAAGGPRKT